MSVSTPILTTSSEICAFAAVPDAPKARPAATTAVSDFIASSPWLLVEGFGWKLCSIRPCQRLQTEQAMQDGCLESARLSGHLPAAASPIARRTRRSKLYSPGSDVTSTLIAPEAS